MTRTLDPDILTELPKGQIQVGILVELDFSDGFVRVWSGIGDVSYGGYTFTGVGTFGTIAPISEASIVRAEGITLQLTGIPSALIATALGATYQGRSAKVWLVFFDTAWAVIEGVLLFKGRMDTMQIEEGPDTTTITLAAESHLADLKRPRIRRYTNVDQQDLFPGDRGLEYIDALQDAEIGWGPGAGGGMFSSPPIISSATTGGTTVASGGLPYIEGGGGDGRGGNDPGGGDGRSPGGGTNEGGDTATV